MSALKLYQLSALYNVVQLAARIQTQLRIVWLLDGPEGNWGGGFSFSTLDGDHHLIDSLCCVDYTIARTCSMLTMQDLYG